MSDSESDNESVDRKSAKRKKSNTSFSSSSKKTYKQIPDELRKMVVMSIENGSCSRRKAAETFNVPYGSVVSIYKRFLDTGKTTKKKGGNKTDRPFSEIDDIHVRELLAENCQYTMKQLKDLLLERFDIDMSIPTITKRVPSFFYTIHRMNTSENEEPTKQQIFERKVYCEHFICVNNSQRVIIHFAEADFKISLRQLARRDEPAMASKIINPTVKHRIKTIMVAMSKNEMFHYKVVKGPGKNAILTEYLVALFEILEKRAIYGAVIIIDDAIFQRFREIKELIEEAGHLLLILTENCPFLNPVERVIDKWSKHLREKNFRSETEMDLIIDSFKKVIKSKHCNKYCQLMLDSAQKCVAGE